MDDLIPSPDGRSLRRGRRTAERHKVERAAYVWRPGEEDRPAVAVALDLSSNGLRLQTRNRFARGTEVLVDIKRTTDIGSDTFIFVRGTVMRCDPLPGQRFDLGIRITAKEPRRR